MQYTKVVNNTKGTKTPRINLGYHTAPKESREDKQSSQVLTRRDRTLYRVPTEPTGQEEAEVGPCKTVCRTQETVVRTQRGSGRRSKRRVGLAAKVKETVLQF